jgi:FkbM family methyltransferase
VTDIPHQTPPAHLRWLAACLRRLPEFRGRWRIERRLDARLAARGWHWRMRVHGAWMDLALEDEIDRQIFVNGVYERAATSMIRRLPLAGGTVVDAGANVGYHTLLFAGLVGPQGKVHALEPLPANRRRLEANLALNPVLAERVRVWPTALADQAGGLEMLDAGPTHSGMSRVPGVPGSRPERHSAASNQRAGQELGAPTCGNTPPEILRVPAITLDELWKQLERPPVTLVKLDLEGYELRVIEGAHTLLNNDPPPLLLVEVFDELLRAHGNGRLALFQRLDALGYRGLDFRREESAFQINETPRDGQLLLFAKRRL